MVEDLSPEFAGSTIETCYQPIVRTSDRMPTGVEALARLNHPGRGILKPGEFVPQIEEAGGARALTRSIISRVLADMRTAQAARASEAALDVWVNFPLDVLLAPDSMVRLSELREAAGLEASSIHVELTESRPVADLDGLRAAIERARAEGFRVALDDYAPTMPLWRELLDLPFSSVKFDHQLVASAAGHAADAAFIRTAIEAAHARGLTAVAEGVEDAATWDRLSAMGVDAVQGFWISPPLSAEEIAPWRRRWSGEG